MIELQGVLKYEEKKEITRNIIQGSKKLKIYYPDNKGILFDGDKLYISNRYLVEKTLKECFEDVNMNIYIKEIYNYDFEKDYISGIDIYLEHKDVDRFIRKNKIKNVLEDES